MSSDVEITTARGSRRGDGARRGAHLGVGRQLRGPRRRHRRQPETRCRDGRSGERDAGRDPDAAWPRARPSSWAPTRRAPARARMRATGPGGFGGLAAASAAWPVAVARLPAPSSGGPVAMGFPISQRLPAPPPPAWPGWHGHGGTPTEGSWPGPAWQAVAASPAIIELRGVTRVYDTGRVQVRRAGRRGPPRAPRASSWPSSGPSGSGKSTLMNLLGCLDRPTCGTYRLDGTDVEQPRRRRPGPAAQPAHRLRLPVLQPAATDERPRQRGHAAHVPGCRPRGRAAGWPPRRCDRLGLGDRLDHEPTELSGGQQQRVAVARASSPTRRSSWPTSRPATSTRHSGAEVMALLHELHRGGRTIVLITHEAEVAGQAARQIHIRDGRVAA